MRKLKPENQMILIAAIIAMAGLVIFLSLIPVHKWLWSGWLFGVASIGIGHGVSILLVKVLLLKQKTKLSGFFSGIARTIINYVIQVGMFFAVIAIDDSHAGHSFLGGGLSPLTEGPIVIYTYLGGISILAISGIASLLIKKKEGADETIRR